MIIPVLGDEFLIPHDGFIGTVIGFYTRRDGRHGVVLQQVNTNVVHVYSLKWLTRLCPNGLCILDGPDVEGGDCVCQLEEK